jgi:hypothetical protein
MPISQLLEERFLEALLSKVNYTATNQYLGLSTLSPTALTKATTPKAFGEHEAKEGEDGWTRQAVSSLTWTKSKGEGATGPTKWVNAAAITWEPTFKKAYVLETFALLPKAKQSEDTAGDAIAFFGKLSAPITVNASTKVLKIEIEALELTAE